MKRREDPAVIGMVDVETTELAHREVPKTKFWGLALHGRYRRFATTRSLFRYLASQAQRTVIYCHHDYDMVQALVDGFALDIQEVRSGRILRALGPGQIEWRNSYALIPAPAREILETCGFVKPELTELEARNKADTVDMLAALFQIAEKYHEVWGIYPLGRSFLTSASVAFAAAEKASGRLPVWLRDRESYRGGRTEAFRVGECGPADCYDINSSYPAAILEAPATDKLYYLDVDARGDGPQPFFHLTPSREKLLFPSGRFRTAVWESNYERYLAPHGGIRSVKVRRTVQADMGWLVRLQELVRHAYQLRAKAKAAGDSVMAFATKLGLNSIYGRLALNGMREVVGYAERIPTTNDQEGVRWYPMPDGRALHFRRVATEPRANYLFASFITCNARARLYHALRSTSNPFYCDTDSVYVPHGAHFPLPQGKALGEWKLEAGPHKLTIQSLKDYRFGNEWKRKGGRKGYTWTPRRALSGDTVKVTKKHRRCLVCKKHVQECRCLSGPVSYDKRRVQSDGSTLPVILAEW